jgi:hypothetical protein
MVLGERVAILFEKKRKKTEKKVKEKKTRKEPTKRQ